VSGEEAKGFVRRAKRCTTVLVVWRRVNLVSKGIKWRVAIGRSSQVKLILSGPRDRSDSINGVAYPMSPNANTSKVDMAELEWTSLWALAEAGSVVADAARAAGGEAHGRTYDLEGWHR
jgi:hypothetical protein